MRRLAACGISLPSARLTSRRLWRVQDLDIDSEVCISYAAGKRWVAIGNRKLSCEPPSQELEVQTPRLKSIWILRDITASKQAEQEREAARTPWRWQRFRPYWLTRLEIR
jgi:hypothetical protein